MGAERRNFRDPLQQLFVRIRTEKWAHDNEIGNLHARRVSPVKVKDSSLGNVIGLSFWIVAAILQDRVLGRNCPFLDAGLLPRRLCSGPYGNCIEVLDPACHHLFFALVPPANGLPGVGVGGIIRAVIVMRRDRQPATLDRRRSALEERPEPRLIRARSEFEKLWPDSLEAFTQAVGGAQQVSVQARLLACELTQENEILRLGRDPPEAVWVGPKGIGEDESVASIVLAPSLKATS